MIRKKTRGELLREILQGVVQETDITLVGQGSVTRAFANAFSGVTAGAYQSLHDAVVNSHLTTASGFYLDVVAEAFGLTRYFPTAAEVTAEDRNIKLYVTSGFLVDNLPHPTDPSLGRVYAGTQISTSSGIVYSTVRDHDFPASSREVFIGAQSSTTGSSQNVGAGALTVNNINNVNSVNLFAITTANDLETDEEFRFRISKWVTSSAGRNETAVTLAVLSAPGVADMIKVPFFAGAGSFKIVVIPTGNRVSTIAMSQIRSNLRRITAEGTFFVVEHPTYVPVSLTVRLIGENGQSLSATDRDLVQNAILRYIGNIRPGEALIINRLRSVALGASANVKDIRLSGLAINRRPIPLNNFILKDDELFLPDEQLDDPIQVI